ncbi:MAG TPA: ComEC/Rec2 family competence protein [Elusimicrobiota bacterium]|nr:ComEC/Rec2 family competence protein [Elusimicrobiota bacterium]
MVTFKFKTPARVLNNRAQMFCYSFVVGVALTVLFFPEFRTGRVLPLSLMGTLFFGLAFFYKRLILLFLGLSAICFGSANFYRVTDTTAPSHISNYYSASFFEPAIVRGTIIHDTDVRERFTNIDIKPEEVIINPEKDKTVVVLKGKTGYMRVKIYPTVGKYYESITYGDRVEIHTPIMPPRALSNPAGFDFARYLKARNIWATGRPIRSPELIKFLGKGSTSWIVDFSLNVKMRLLASLKRTMTFPESAFLGGVELGLRSGVPESVKYQFQATGVAHVLAVSGLHVGFVHLLLVTFCSAFRVPKKATWFVVVFGLIVFTIITGASPATKRAALMSSIGQFIYTFGGFGFRGSSALTIPIAAFILLIPDPLVISEASFILSFAAVWSLVSLSDSVNDIFVRNEFTRGFIFFPAFFVLVLFTILSFVSIATEIRLVREILPFFASEHFLMKNYLPDWRIMTLLLYLTGVGIFFGFKKRTGQDLIYEIYYGRFGWWKGFCIFTVAQLAIQIGMMIPLSSYYFYRFPIAGIYANFFAIPLIGYIVQVSLISGLLDMFCSGIGLPFFGQQLAFLINAGNWPLAQMFLGMAKSWSGYIPYGYMTSFTTSQMTWYYVGVFLFGFWKFFSKWGKVVYGYVVERKALRWSAVFLGAGLLTVASYQKIAQRKEMKIVFFDVGYGNSLLLQSPGGKAFLIDGGRKEFFDFSSTTLIPTLSKAKISRIEAVVVTAPLEVCMGGLLGILSDYPVDKVYSSLDEKVFTSDLTYHEFLEKMEDPQYVRMPISRKTQASYLLYYDFLRILKRNKLDYHRPVSGDVLCEEIHGDKKFQIRVLSPTPGSQTGLDDPLRNNSIVLKVTYGKTSVLLAQQLGMAGEWRLIDRWGDELKSDVLLVPSNGNPQASTDEFLSVVAPKDTVVQYGFLSKYSRDSEFFYGPVMNQTLKRYESRGIRWFRTDMMGAVTLHSDGETYRMETILGENRTLEEEKRGADRMPASENESILVAL